MGASSSGLLDEAKVTHIKGLLDNSFQRFSAFYRQQYAAAHYGHVHMEVEPKKEGRGLILTQRPQYDPQTVFYQNGAKFSCSWDEQGKKCRERYVVLRRDYSVEVHENTESFSGLSPPKLVIQPAGGSVFTTDDEFRVHLEKICSGIFNGAREDSSLVVTPPDTFAVYLQLPYRGHSCFLFQQEKERDHFLSHLKTCIRHRNLDPWRGSSLESQAYARALRLYRQDKGCYESWEMQLGSEEQVMASQVMEEVLPWLQTQLQAKVKGKRLERIRLWQTTVQATYTMVLEQLTAELQSLRDDCHQTASANQMLLRSNLDQIVTSHHFLEQKVKECVCKEAEEVCSGSITPYLSSMTEALTEVISAAFVGMREELHARMDSAFSEPTGGAEQTKQVSSGLSPIRLDLYYQQVEEVAGKLEDLKERFGEGDTQRLILSTHLEMEQLMDNALFTLEQFIKSSAQRQSSQAPVKMERAKERVLKQLDYDSRMVQRRLYQEALLEITLPFLTKTMDRRWRTELHQFEQYIFSDYSSFLLVQNVYQDVLRNILRTEIERVFQDAASRKSNNLLLDMSDLALSQYSLLGPTPPRSTPESPALHHRLSSSVVPFEDEEPPHLKESRGETAACSHSEQEVCTGAESQSRSDEASEQSGSAASPVIIVTQELCEEQSSEQQSEAVVAKSGSGKTEPIAVTETSTSESERTDEAVKADPPSDTESKGLNPEDQVSVETKRDHSSTPDSSSSHKRSEDFVPIEVSPPDTDRPVKISLGSLSEAISCTSTEIPVMTTMVQQVTDRAVYLTGEMKDNWEAENVKERAKEEAEKKEEHTVEKAKGGEDTVRELLKDSCTLSGVPAEGAVTEQGESKGNLEEADEAAELKMKMREAEGAADRGHQAEGEAGRLKEDFKSSQPIESQQESVSELPLDSIVLIRELVTEVIEVERVVSPSASHTTMTEPSADESDVQYESKP